MTVLVRELGGAMEAAPVTGTANAVGGEEPEQLGTAQTQSSPAVRVRTLTGWVASRSRDSPWRAVALRVLGAALALGALAAAGMWAATAHPATSSAAPLLDSPGTWIAGAASPETTAAGPSPLSASQGPGAPPRETPAQAQPPAAEGEDAGRSGPSGASPGVTADGRVVLNAATTEEFTRLPGVGIKRAMAIVQLRDRLGRFRNPSELLRVRGIGPRTLKKMLPHLVVDAPATRGPAKPPPQ